MSSKTYSGEDFLGDIKKLLKKIQEVNIDHPCSSTDVYEGTIRALIYEDVNLKKYIHKFNFKYDAILFIACNSYERNGRLLGTSFDLESCILNFKHDPSYKSLYIYVPGKKIPVQVGPIYTTLDLTGQQYLLGHNQLTTLENSPKFIDGDLWVKNNPNLKYLFGIGHVTGKVHYDNECELNEMLINLGRNPYTCSDILKHIKEKHDEELLNYAQSFFHKTNAWAPKN